MIPFLVSRVAVCGAGGWDPTNATGCIFTLSPKAAYITSEISDCSTDDRGIFHTKDEPLASQGHRLHVLLGESLSTATGNYLKLATTAPVSCHGRGRAKARRSGRVRNPVQALRTYAADPTLSTTARSTCGRDLSALDIQRHYLSLAQTALATDQQKTSIFPGWAAKAVAAWDDILSKLERDSATITSLDWPIKRAVAESCLKSFGFSWDLLNWWNQVHSICALCQSGPTEVAGGQYVDEIPAEPAAILAHCADSHRICSHGT